MLARKFGILFAITILIVFAFQLPASAQAITCPATAIANGNPADAGLVTSWFSCKAPTDSPFFTGNVGIGTGSPNVPLEISGSAVNLKMAITNTAGGHKWTFNSGNNGFFYLGDDTAGANRFVVDAYGNIGIGTTSPSFPVELDSAAVALKLALHNTNASGHIWTLNSSNTGTFYLGDDTAGANRLSIDTSGTTSINGTAIISGSVGIGTNTPGSPLEIAANVGNLKLAINNVSSTGHKWTLNSSSNGYLYIGDDTAPANRLVINTAGNVGIGTTTPSQALEVNGKIQVDSLASASSTALCVNANVLSSCSSSLRYKENVQSAKFGLREIEAMRPVTFKWKGRDENDFGLIAEAVAKINPLFVTYKAGKIEGVKYPQLVAVLIGAIKEQQNQVEQLADTNVSLRTQLLKQGSREDARFAELKQEVANLRARSRIRTAQK